MRPPSSSLQRASATTSSGWTSGKFMEFRIRRQLVEMGCEFAPKSRRSDDLGVEPTSQRMSWILWIARVGVRSTEAKCSLWYRFRVTSKDNKPSSIPCFFFWFLAGINARNAVFGHFPITRHSKWPTENKCYHSNPMWVMYPIDVALVNSDSPFLTLVWIFLKSPNPMAIQIGMTFTRSNFWVTEVTDFDQKPDVLTADSDTRCEIRK